MKDIPGYEGLYAVTEDDVLWSYPKGKHKGKYLIPHKDKKGYLTSHLSRNGEVKSLLRHRLVAITYIHNPDNLPLVLHLDNNPLNNHVSNLKWGTHKENSQQAHDDGLNPKTEKWRKSMDKLWTVEMREKTREMGLSGGKKIMQLTREGILCRIYVSVEICINYSMSGS